MTQNGAINKLLRLGVITKAGSAGYYIKNDPYRKHRSQVLLKFTTYDYWDANSYVVNMDAVNSVLNEPTYEHIDRQSYHSGERDYSISHIAADSDGVIRSFGLEFEIGSLTPLVEDKLVKLLRTLPKHICERDGSLSDRGVEVIFMPLSANDYINTVNTLKQFVNDNAIDMGPTGMHTTYGVSNHSAAKNDLQIRLNRIALYIKALCSKDKIRAFFGRDFGGYCALPMDTTAMSHSNAFSCNGREENCWECRLPKYTADPNNLVKFFKLTEIVFHRPLEVNEYETIYNLIEKGE